MALVRALIFLHHNSRLFNPGEEFEYENSDKLTDPAVDGMELVTAESTRAYTKAELKKLKELQAKAGKAQDALNAAKDALTADPANNALVTAVLDAETAFKDANDAVNAFAAPNSDDLV